MFSIIRSRQVDKTATLRLRGLGYSETAARTLILWLRDAFSDSPRRRRDEVVELAPEVYAVGLEGREMQRFYRAASALSAYTLHEIRPVANLLLRSAGAGRLMPSELLDLEHLGVPEWMIDQHISLTTLRDRAENGHVTYEHVITSILDAEGHRP